MGDFHDRLAADLVGGAQERFVAELTERAARMLADAVANPDRFRLLDRLSPLGAMGLWAEWRDRVTDECREAWESAVSDEDELLVSSLARYLGGRSYETSYAANVAAEAARGMAEIMRCENVALASSVEREWYSAVADAVSRVEAGESRRRVMEEAVAKLASEGITTIDYRTGTRMAIDAALRRHIVTQANQARNDLLWRRMDEWGADLVFTSAHYGARPSHAVWQGRVFSRSGTSKAYPSLVEATGYGTAGGLCGVNCRHTMTPYVEGISKLPDTDYGPQEKLTGLSSDEYYAATQAQRRLEAKVRATKREIALGEASGVDETPARVRLGELQGRLLDHCEANGQRRSRRDATLRRRVRRQARQGEDGGVRDRDPAGDRWPRGRALSRHPEGRARVPCGWNKGLRDARGGRPRRRDRDAQPRPALWRALLLRQGRLRHA